MGNVIRKIAACLSWGELFVTTFSDIQEVLTYLKSLPTSYFAKIFPILHEYLEEFKEADVNSIIENIIKAIKASPLVDVSIIGETVLTYPKFLPKEMKYDIETMIEKGYITLAEEIIHGALLLTRLHTKLATDYKDIIVRDIEKRNSNQSLGKNHA